MTTTLRLNQRFKGESHLFHESKDVSMENWNKSLAQHQEDLLVNIKGNVR